MAKKKVEAEPITQEQLRDWSKRNSKREAEERKRQAELKKQRDNMKSQQ